MLKTCFVYLIFIWIIFIVFFLKNKNKLYLFVFNLNLKVVDIMDKIRTVQQKVLLDFFK